MNTYAITITETLTKTVLIEEENLEKAIEKAEESYRNCDVILEESCLDNVTFGPSEYWKDGIYDGDDKDCYLQLK